MKITCIVPVWNQEDLVFKALGSIPRHWEVIIVEDGSTDDTLSKLREWSKRAIIDHKLLVNPANMGVGYSVNRGIDAASGDYIVLLGSDDWFTEEIHSVERMINGEDMVFFDLEINDGSLIKLRKGNYMHIPGSVKFMRREWIGDIRNNNERNAEDLAWMNKLLTLPHTVKFSNVVAKRYNHPREGSLSS